MKMNQKSMGCFLTILLILIIPAQLVSENSDQQSPKKLSDYRTVQWISYKGFTPVQIMRLDNNSDLVLACKNGKTRKQLQEMGISVNDSQLRLLQIFRVITLKDGLIKTAYPILGPSETRRIWTKSKIIAKNLATLIHSDVKEMVAFLKSWKRDKTAYTILFALTLDGMIWQNFREAGLTHPKKITAEQPFWSGEIWSYYPQRSFSCGTNTFVRGDYVVVLNWNKTANHLLSPFYRVFLKIDKKKLGAALSAGVFRDPQLKKTFATYGICDQTGRILLPVIKEDPKNKLYQISSRICKKMTRQLTSAKIMEQFTKTFRFRDIQQAMVIVYHEIMWDLMDEMEKSLGIKKPLAMVDAKKASPKNVAELMFLVEPKK
jgi:hypothetical protein